MLYFRSFVGQEYEDGKWKQNPNALSEELLEDYEKMINMKLEDVPSFHPVIRNMEVSYRDDEIDALYPYYTTSLKNEDGLVYYVSVGDYNQFWIIRIPLSVRWRKTEFIIGIMRVNSIISY